MNQIQDKPWQSLANEVTETLNAVAPQEFESAFGLLGVIKGKLFFSGQGRSGLIAEMGAMRFMHLGYQVHYVGEATAPAITNGDCLVLFCGSGKTPVSTSFATLAKKAHAKIVLFTSAETGPIATVADTILRIPVQRTKQFGGSLFEQTSLLLVDALALRLEKAKGVGRDEMWGRHTDMQ